MRRAVTVLGLAASLAVLPLGLPGAQASAPTTTPARVVITQLSPLTPQPGGTLVVGGTVTDTVAGPLSSLQVGLYLGQPVPNRSTLHLETEQPPIDTVRIPNATVTGPVSLAAGATAAFRIQVPLDTIPGLDPSRLAVYPLQVHVDGLVAGVAERLGQSNTFLPYFPGRPSSPLHVVWLWPLDTVPALDVGGAFTSRRLAHDLAGGRLAGLLQASVPRSAAAPLAPVTYLVEPSLLQAAAALSVSWSLVGHGAQPPVSGARQFLSTLAAQVTAGAGLAALPYGDPDVVALRRAGLGADVLAAFPLGARIVADVLHQPPTVSLYRPPGGVVNQDTLDTLAEAGVSTLVLNDSQLPTVLGSAVPTASAVTSLPTLGPPVRGLAADDYLDQLLAAGGRGAPSLRLAEQLVLAETALVVTEAPNYPQVRDLVLSPPRYWNPVPGFAHALLAATRQAGWLDTVPLSATAADPAGARTPLGPYPASARAAELPQRQLTAAGGPLSFTSLRTELSDTASMLTDQGLLAPVSEALYRSASVGWRRHPAGQLRLDRQIAGTLDNILAQVRVASAPQVTLTSRTGHIPVTISNDLSQPVTVVLTVGSPDPSKLRPLRSVTQTVGAHQNQRVLITAQTQRTGTFTVSLQLSTPDGRPLGPSVPVLVHSSAYGAAALAITGGALGVLVLALLYRGVRRLRHRTRAPGVSGVPG